MKNFKRVTVLFVALMVLPMTSHAVMIVNTININKLYGITDQHTKDINKLEHRAGNLSKRNKDLAGYRVESTFDGDTFKGNNHNLKQISNKQWQGVNSGVKYTNAQAEDIFKKAVRENPGSIIRTKGTGFKAGYRVKGRVGHLEENLHNLNEDLLGHDVKAHFDGDTFKGDGYSLTEISEGVWRGDNSGNILSQAKVDLIIKKALIENPGAVRQTFGAGSVEASYSVGRVGNLEDTAKDLTGYNVAESFEGDTFKGAGRDFTEISEGVWKDNVSGRIRSQESIDRAIAHVKGMNTGDIRETFGAGFKAGHRVKGRMDLIEDTSSSLVAGRAES